MHNPRRWQPTLASTPSLRASCCAGCYAGAARRLLVTRLVAPVVVVVVVPLVALLVALVVALSGFPYKESVRKCLRAGALVVEPLKLLLIVLDVLKVPSARVPYLSW